MDESTDEILLAELNQLRSLLSDARDLVFGSTQAVQEAVGDFGGALSEIGDARARTSQVSRELESLLETSASHLREIGGLVPGLAGSAEPLTNEMNGLEVLTKEVEDLAYQTLLSALNASVAAERAGSAGVVFSVIAREISLLPEQALKCSEDVRAAIAGASGDLEKLSSRLAEVVTVGHDAMRFSTEESVVVRDQIAAHGERVTLAAGVATKLREATDSAAARSFAATAQLELDVGNVAAMARRAQARLAAEG